MTNGITEFGWVIDWARASGWSLWSAAADSDQNLMTIVFRLMIDSACAVVAQADGFLDIKNSMRAGFQV